MFAGIIFLIILDSADVAPAVMIESAITDAMNFLVFLLELMFFLLLKYIFCNIAHGAIYH